jgi:BlaI family transcriptional regulator, penicillinase repressor
MRANEPICAMTTKPIELTEAEWSIIKAVWEKEPCTAPDVQLKLAKQTEWTYSTVRTLMDRMVAKGLLAAEKVRNLTLYRSAVTREQAQRGELLYALKHAFNGALTPLVQCLLDTNEVTREELDQLKQIIGEHEQGTSPARKGGAKSASATDRASFGVPPSGGSRALPPEGGTPNKNLPVNSKSGKKGAQ